MCFTNGSFLMIHSPSDRAAVPIHDDTKTPVMKMKIWTYIRAFRHCTELHVIMCRASHVSRACAASNSAPSTSQNQVQTHGSQRGRSTQATSRDIASGLVVLLLAIAAVTFIGKRLTEKKLSKNVRNHHVMYTVTTIGNRTALRQRNVLLS
jgi:hypothetical protein